MYRKEKRIPTILALLFILLAIGSILYLDKSSQSGEISAKNTAFPEDVHFTNITDNSLTVSWFTAQETQGFISISDGPKTTTFLDDLDNDNIPRARYNHYVTAKNLKVDTGYTVKILNTNGKCPNNLVCPTFRERTATKLPPGINLPPARGVVILENQPVEAIIYLTVGKSAPLSARTDSSGLWVISFNNLRSQDLLSRILLADTDLVQITAKSAPDKSASAVIDLKSIRQNLSLPTMQIGKTYNFINLLSKKESLAKSGDQNILGIYDLLFPLQDEETTSDNQPRFRGIAPKGTAILITINSLPQVGRVTTSPDGTWSWRPPRPLSPGTHQISLQGYDEKGNLVTITRKFIVLKSGERVLGEATVSATLTPTAIPSPTITSTPVLIIPTIQTTPIFTPSPTSTPITITPPASGTFKPTFLLLGGGVALMLIGIKFLTAI